MVIARRRFGRLFFCIFVKSFDNIITTVKLGDKERFGKEQVGVKEPYSATNC